ncbi:hypothetical protein OTERR_19660 [Oryzomicrobium terrae]|uniref:Uncharacterized protein n=1 Tax=Oryzomicrobium terrae TaxID=1735038 RepID=A0A5C1E908_9RHOO|nr:hypothetical protein [Oryzomicrobium terrae]QEL65442.1 hypothetical protein OTERR_19660 [Oryzomicrobium terrae]
MQYDVVVVYGRDREYTFRFTEADLQGTSDTDARRWFDKEFVDLECEPTNPMGKVLIIDKILNVAKYGGEARFGAGNTWGQTFARNTAAALQRPTVRIDVPAFQIGF